jgi:hypothetical protein
MTIAHWLHASKILFQLVIGCALASIIFGLCSALSLPMLLSANPLISAFIHVDFYHFASNLFLLLWGLITSINQSLSFKDLYKTSVFLSLLYYPLACLDIFPPAVGLSALGYYLMSRFFCTSGNVWKCLGFVLFLAEAIEISSTSDTAHLLHCLGWILGFHSCFPLQQLIKKWI